MIKTTRQLKDKMNNLSKGNSNVAKLYIETILWSVF